VEREARRDWAVSRAVDLDQAAQTGKAEHVCRTVQEDALRGADEQPGEADERIANQRMNGTRAGVERMAELDRVVREHQRNAGDHPRHDQLHDRPSQPLSD